MASTVRTSRNRERRTDSKIRTPPCCGGKDFYSPRKSRLCAHPRPDSEIDTHIVARLQLSHHAGTSTTRYTDPRAPAASALGARRYDPANYAPDSMGGRARRREGPVSMSTASASRRMARRRGCSRSVLRRTIPRVFVRAGRARSRLCLALAHIRAARDGRRWYNEGKLLTKNRSTTSSMSRSSGQAGSHRIAFRRSAAGGALMARREPCAATTAQSREVPLRSSTS